MNKLVALFVILASFVMSCGTTNKANNTDGHRMHFIVTKIQNEKDGQTIFLKDGNQVPFTTVISPANGNFVELEVGDEISLIAEEILEMHPALIISKDIIVVAEPTLINIEYEKEEIVSYWINAKKTEAFDMAGNPIPCLQFQEASRPSANAEWNVVCDEIANFDYKEGTFYQIKVAKKWLKDHELLADRAPYDLELVEIVQKKKSIDDLTTVDTTISTDKPTYKIGEPILLTLEVKNTGDQPFTFLPWATPVEKTLTGDCLNVMIDLAPVFYNGIMVKRMAPTKKDYITLKPNTSTTGTINVLDGYELNKKGTYYITFKETYKELPTSNTIEVIIE